MTPSLEMLNEELADTLARARDGRFQKAPRRQLARQVVGAPRAPRSGVCVYCGAAALADVACAAHSDLPYLDPAMSAEVTETTTGPSGAHLDGARARRARGGHRR